MSLDIGQLGGWIVFFILLGLFLFLRTSNLFFAKYGLLLASLVGWGLWVYGCWIAKSFDELIQEEIIENVILLGIIFTVILTWGIVEYFKNRKYTKESFKLRKNQKQ